MIRKTKRGIESAVDNIKDRATNHSGIVIAEDTEDGRVEDSTTGRVFDSIEEINEELGPGMLINLTGGDYDTTDET